MTQPAIQKRHYTVEEYLQLEAESEEKHEYLDGQIVALGELLAMAGGSINHSLIAANVVRQLGNRLVGKSCQIFGSDLRVRIPNRVLYAYPDITVVCGPVSRDKDPGMSETVTNPRLIVEVLSPGTELYDRREKFERYWRIPSLQEYVLVSQNAPRVETYVRQDEGAWLFTVADGLDAAARLRSVEIELPLKEIYAGVEFPPT